MPGPSSLVISAQTAVIAVFLILAAAPATAGDASKGKAVFSSQCALCHSGAKGGPTILGPSLYGIIGRKSASVPGYAYSTGMKAVGWIWTDEKLETYLPAPRTLVPGTKMSYGGLKDATKRADLIAYLDTLK